MHAELLALKRGVPVDPVQREQREHRRVGTPAPHRGRELTAEPARHGPAVPLVEIPHEDARPGEALGVADEDAEQAELLAPFSQRQPEVAVEDVQRRTRDVQVDAKAASRLTHAAAQVAPARSQHGQAGEDDVAVRPGPVRPGLAHDDLRHVEPRRQVRGLIGVRHAFFADHFLQAHDVGRDLRDDVGDPVQVATAVESDTAVDVVAHDGEVHHTASG